MKKITTIKLSLLSAFVATSAFATSVTFNVDTNFVFDGATEITKANASGYTALGVFGDLSSADFSSVASFAGCSFSFWSRIFWALSLLVALNSTFVADSVLPFFL